MAIASSARVRFVFLALTGALLAAGCGSSGGSSALADEPDDPAVSIEVDSRSVVIQEGGAAELAVRLSSAPAGSVTVAATVIGGTGTFEVEGADSRQFDETNWDRSQAITVRAASDDDNLNNWGRLQLVLDAGFDVLNVDLTQQDTDGSPVTPDGVTLQVADVNGAGAMEYPVLVVIPLEYGAFQDTDDFRIVDPAGNPVPAQFDVVNRWWARDRSIRHVAAQFQVTVPPNERVPYTFQTTGSGPDPQDGVQVTEDGGNVTVDTGPLRFTVKRGGFNLFDEVWLDTNGDGSFSSAERIVESDTGNGPVFTGRLPGDLQQPADRDDIVLEVEESGPMRSVIRISAPAIYESTSDHTHGWAVRIYAYAGKSFVKVDYQLQNSAKNAKWSWPLYLEDLSLHLKPSLSNPTVRLATGPGNVWSGSPGSGRYLVQSTDSDTSVRQSSDDAALLTGTNEDGRSSYAWADVSDADRGVFVAIRHMAEMWPNGVEVADDAEIAVRLWPRWSAEWYQGALNTTGLYWIEDMQHVYKEVLFHFHGPGVRSEDLDDLAVNFQQHPIGIVPTNWYYRTAVTLDLDGFMPSPDPVPGEDEKQIAYTSTRLDPTHYYYALGWMNFGGETERKGGTGSGSWPRSSLSAMATERIDYWLRAEAFLRDNVNCRPQSMEGYTYEEDFEFLELIHNPAASMWRSEDPDRRVDPSKNLLAQQYLAGTEYGSGWSVRDNQHMWTYLTEESYYLTANPWVRDWYEFMTEFRLAERSMDEADETWMRAHDYRHERAEGHTWGATLQAYRVTGDSRLLDYMRNRMRDSVLANRNPKYGTFGPDEDETAPFQAGFFCRAMVQLMTETRGHERQLHDDAFQVVWGMVDWNYNLAQFSYYFIPATDTPGSLESSGTSTIMVDPVCWFCFKTGNKAILDQARTYVSSGLNGGRYPYGGGIWSDDFDMQGGYVARMAEYATTYTLNVTPPAAIGDLSATATGNEIRIEWTTPERAKRFHVIWGEKPFTADYAMSDDVRSPWAGRAVGTDLEPQHGQRQSLTFTADGAGSGDTVYVIVYTFAEDGLQAAMSPISNVASVSIP